MINCYIEEINIGVRVVDSLKVIHIVPTLQVGGVAEVWINLTRTLAELGHEIHLVGPYIRCLENYVNSYNVASSPPSIAKDPFYSAFYKALNKKLIEEVLKREKPDVTLTHGPLALTCLENTNIPCFSVVHGTYVNEIKFMKYHPLRGLARIRHTYSIKATHAHDLRLYKILTCRNVSLIAVSTRTREELMIGGIKAEKVFSILNGVDKNLFKPFNDDEARKVLEKKYGIKIEGLVIAHVGLGPIKGTHVLVKTLAMMKKKGLNFTALFAGRLLPKSYRSYVEELIRAFDLSNNIKFLEWVPRELIPYIYSVADITVVPSYSEGAPLVIPESLACSTPVVATKVGGNAEYLRLVELDDMLIDLTTYDFSAELLSKLVKFINSIYSIRKKLSKNLSIIPSWNNVGKKYLEVIYKVLYKNEKESFCRSTGTM